VDTGTGGLEAELEALLRSVAADRGEPPACAAAQP